MDREKLIEILHAHMRTRIQDCHCGWAELGRSHIEHVADEILKGLGVLPRADS